MKRAVRVLLAVSMLGLGIGHANAAPYDSIVFANQYPVYTGSDVGAVAVDFVNSRFVYRPVVGPGVIYRRSHYPWWYYRQ